MAARATGAQIFALPAADRLSFAHPSGADRCMADTTKASLPQASARARPIAYYLVVLALVAFVPVMAFAAVLLQRNNEAQQEIVQTLILTTTGAVGEAVDRQTDGMITTLKGFSSTPLSTTDDLRQLYYTSQSVLAGTGAYLSL